VTAGRLRPSFARAVVLALLLLAAAGAARAQLGGSVSLQTDHRFRGLSLSDERPSARLTLSVDAASGWYAGASVAGVRVDGERRAQWLLYGGRAGRLGNGLAWDAGATAVHVAGSAGTDYAELYTGLIGDRWTARVHFSPEYYGRSERTLYAEVNAAQPLTARWRLFGHAGALVRLDGAERANGRRARADLRAGVAAGFEAWDVQLAWVGVQHDTSSLYDAPGYGAGAPDRSAVVLGVSYAF
jgi:uncharacterized protein (TIGR02001 family)